jgi:hypothetical protein
MHYELEIGLERVSFIIEKDHPLTRCIVTCIQHVHNCLIITDFICILTLLESSAEGLFPMAQRKVRSFGKLCDAVYREQVQV